VSHHSAPSDFRTVLGSTTTLKIIAIIANLMIAGQAYFHALYVLSLS
jgi:hypothetical protein